ncbi:N-acetyl-gamma-glutamyl-phosphate reductase [Parasaccharibacter apium]|nr:N-acetyl-gamma-glutamyl-phosphate reductase [Parasaccharibacter apium]
MTTRIFIDGEAGTTGLGIRRRIEAVAERYGLTLLSIDPARRKDPQARQELMAQADITVLCLPDDAAREAVALGHGTKTRFLDASTAHRVDPDWVYGLPELDSTQPERIRKARFVSNPGCYATGAIALLRPLVQAGIIPMDAHISINAVSGYSGGGKALIEQQEAEGGPPFFLYGLNLQHKHLPEMTHYSGLTRNPLFVPSVGHFPQGMIVSIPLHLVSLPGVPMIEDVTAALQAFYKDAQTIRVVESEPKLTADALAGRDDMELRVSGHSGQALLTARLDNLGKGASGAAMRNILLMSGKE